MIRSILQRYIPGYKNRGFALPLTLVVCAIILSVSAGISVILTKELYFSRLSRQSQLAYYAADDGLMCALMVDDHYVDPATGIGIFQYNNLVTVQSVLDNINTERQARGYAPLALTDIKCATAGIFANASTTPFSRVNNAGNTETGITTSFTLTMDLGNGQTRCASVLVNKTASYRQIVSRGYTSCPGSNTSITVERAIVNTSDSLGTATSTPPPASAYALTTGTSWVVPAGVTSINVWVIGGGGGGAGSPGNDATAGGGGGAGGVAYKTFTVTPGSTITYALGSGGPGGVGPANGTAGGDTTINVAGYTMRARGGNGGQYNNGVSAAGGSSVDGTSNYTGGTGYGVSGDTGGGGGGGLNGGNGTGNGASGGTGGLAIDMNGLFATLSTLGYPAVSAGVGPGSGASPSNGMNGSNATGFGAGGGGAGYYGGNGGNGLWGGGGGGAAGYTIAKTGGAGGQGIIIISTGSGGAGGPPSPQTVLLTSGTSWNVPSGYTSMKVWAIGGGGGGAGASASAGNAGDGGGAGGVTYGTFTVAGGQTITYALGTGGAGSPNQAGGTAGTQTSVTIGGTTLIARGGAAGDGGGNGGIGGGGSGGTTVTGGSGTGAIGDIGGGGGGGIGGANAATANCNGAPGAQALDVSGLFAALTAGGYPTTAGGTSGTSNCSAPVADGEPGGSATGYGSGAGGGGWSGGNGGNGLYGGGGGGAGGGAVVHSGGNGGAGAVVLYIQ